MKKGFFLISILMLVIISSGCIYLQSDIDELNNKIADKDSKIDSLEKMNTFYEKQIDTLNTEKEQMSNQIKLLSEKKNSLLVENEQLKGENQRLSQIEKQSTTTPPPMTNPPTSPQPTTAPPGTILDISFKEFDAIFGDESGLTSIQKDELLETQYKGRFVRWEGFVDDDIREAFLGDYCMYIRDIGSNSADFQVCYEKEFKNQLLQLNKGDRVIITAEIQSIHHFYPDYDLNGIDIEEK